MPALQLFGLNAAPVVANAKHEDPDVVEEFHAHMPGVRVTGHVCERFLKRTENSRGDRILDVGAFVFDAHLDVDSRAQGEILNLPLDGVGKPELVQHARPKLGDDAAHGEHQAIHASDHVACALGELAGVLPGENVLEPREVELESREGLTEFVVELARDTDAFLFADGMEVRREDAQLLAGTCDVFGCLMPVGDVALDPDVSRHPAELVANHEVVSLDAHGSAVATALVGLAVQRPGIEHGAPSGTTAREVVGVEVRRRHADELGQFAPVLPRVRVVGDGHPLVVKHVVEQRFLVRGSAPVDRLIEHHDEEAVEGLRKEQLVQHLLRDVGRVCEWTSLRWHDRS